MTYQPPKSVLEVLQKIQQEEALAEGDPRYVDTQSARGSDQTLNRLGKKFGWSATSNAFFAPLEKHVLFFGHIGSGKTTELRRYARAFNDSKRFYVVEVDALAKLDRNNLQYSEVLLAMAESLFERLHGDGYSLSDAELAPVRDWFTEHVKTLTTQQDMSAELQAGLKASAGFPGLINLFGRFTSSIKHGSNLKTEWREKVRADFTSLSRAFNRVIRSAEATLQGAGRAQRVLFLIDGTDKMRGEDTEKFFIHDAEQLSAIETLAIYTAPLHLKYNGALGGKLDADMILPMIKLSTQTGERWEPGWVALRALLLHRIDRSLFEDGAAGDAQIDRLIEHCGGHPRELLRLIRLSCEFADYRIDAEVVRQAIKSLASDYQRFLTPSDYLAMVEVDHSAAHAGNDATVQQLLHRVALLEYNDGSWRRSHPAVRTLPGYALALGNRGKVALLAGTSVIGSQVVIPGTLATPALTLSSSP